MCLASSRDSLLVSEQGAEGTAFSEVATATSSEALRRFVRHPLTQIYLVYTVSVYTGVRGRTPHPLGGAGRREGGEPAGAGSPRRI